MPRKLKGSVVVITGASSGIGRAAALEFARNKANLVLAARREDALRDTARECESLGARAIAVPTDVRDEDAVRKLADEAVSTFGRLDVWVNNAGVSLFGNFEEAPSDVYRNVFETNYFGTVHGVRAALPHFREQGAGVIINNTSVFGQIAPPYLSAYASSKFAIRGLGESLWEELRDDNIFVCTVAPASIDTPIFQHAANYSGKAIKPLEPIYDAQEVADAIVKLAQKPEKERIVGRAGSALSATRRLSPTGAARGMAYQVAQDHFQDRPEDPGPGNVLEPDPEYTDISGGWKSNGGGGDVVRAMLATGIIAVPAYLAWRSTRDGKPLASLTDSQIGSRIFQRSQPVTQRATSTIKSAIRR